MGVTGLWRLIEPAGKPVPIETLENKVLAVDISIWLHQMVKGFQDAKGAPMPNAHLLGLFQRVCKLLYYRIKPVFVFDGGFPDLKKETIAKRHDNKAKLNSESERLKREVLLLLGKKTAIGSLLGKQTSPKKAPRLDNTAEDDLFKLPEMEKAEDTSSESESEDEDTSIPVVDLHSVDLESENFKNLPTKEKYDVLLDLKETRKMNSWGKLHELPKDSDNFSSFQMNRLLKRRKVQECLEETEKEIGGSSMTLNELECLLNEEGISTNMDSLPTKRIAADDRTRYLLISNVKQALADARKKEIEKAKATVSPSNNVERKCEENMPNDKDELNKNDELDDDLQKAIKMSLECVDDENDPGKNKTGKGEDSPDSSFMLDSDYSDTSEEEVNNFDFNAAKAFIMQNTDFTSDTITHIVSKSAGSKLTKSKNILDEVLKELEVDDPKNSTANSERICDCEDKYLSVLDLSSSDDDECVEINKSCNSVTEINSVSPEQKTILLDSSVEDISIVTTLGKPHDAADKVLKKLDVDVADSLNGHKSTHVTEENKYETKAQYLLPSNNECVEVHKRDTSVRNDKSITPKKEIVVLDSTVEDIMTSEESSEKEELKVKPLQESSDSDEDFEEVPDPECNVSHSSKPIVELNLELKGTLEDDIFGDIFENKSQEVKIYDESILEVDNDKVTSNYDPDTTPPTKGSSKLSKVVRSRESKDKQNQNEKITLVASEVASDKIIKITEEQIKDTGSSSSATDTENKLDPELKSSEGNFQREILTNEQLHAMAEQLETEAEDLLQAKSRLERMGRNITEQMTQDAQELLQIFGIPYIVAPCEAEAQCAFLEIAKLTDGTITDDSDIWLFGGRTVYKNFFNQKKLVMQFLSERIDKSFNLSREQLILLALLVGSDYTTGVNGVGPVTAMEILASFSCSRKDLLLFQASNNPQAKYAALLTGLQEFKKWLRSGRRTDDNSLKKKLKNISVADDFPSVRVVQAYMEPKIETSKENFTWGEPDVTVLRDYTLKKFGWSKNKLDEILNPVLKRMQDKKTQRTMQDYFQRRIEFQSLDDQMSKRVKAAVEKMGSVDDTEIMKPPNTELKKRKTVPKAKKKGADRGKSDISTEASTSSQSKSEMKITKVIAEPAVTVSGFDIVVPKLDRYQEIIPQREKDKMNVLKTKLKAIETYRKAKLDQKGGKKRKPNLPKADAQLSESSDSS